MQALACRSCYIVSNTKSFQYWQIYSQVETSLMCYLFFLWTYTKVPIKVVVLIESCQTE